MKTTTRFLAIACVFLAVATSALATGPHATIVRQYRVDTGAEIPFTTGTVPTGIGVYFEATVSSDEGRNVRLEVELRQLPASFSGTANYVSSYVSSGTRARTSTATGMAAGNWGWKYRIVDTTGLSTAWQAAGNPDFIVQGVNQPPTHNIANQVRADTGANMALGAAVPSGVGVYFRVTPTDPEGDTVRMEVELHQLPASFTGTPNYVSSYVVSGSVATTATATGLAAGNYGWRYRVVDSGGHRSLRNSVQQCSPLGLRKSG